MEDTVVWGKSLEDFPCFTIKELLTYRQNNSNITQKSLTRGRQFKEERFLSSNSIFTRATNDLFHVKGRCKASMKGEFRNVYISINRQSSDVNSASCTCPAGANGFCHHTVALMLELADYSLMGKKTVPEESSPTSGARKWGIPGPSGSTKFIKEPVMNYGIHSSGAGDKRGIRCTLYDPRLDTRCKRKIQDMTDSLKKIDPLIGYAHYTSQVQLQDVHTKYGAFPLGSPLSFHLKTFESNFKVISNLMRTHSSVVTSYCMEDLPDLPTAFIASNNSNLVPNWALNYSEKLALSGFAISEQPSFEIEMHTREQAKSEVWHDIRKNRITSSNAHKVLIRKRCYESLIPLFCENSKPMHELNPKLQNLFRHGIKFEPVARDKYLQAMRNEYRRNIIYRDCGFIIQPALPWLGGTPDGVIIDHAVPDCRPILLEINVLKQNGNSLRWNYLRTNLFIWDVKTENHF